MFCGHFPGECAGFVETEADDYRFNSLTSSTRGESARRPGQDVETANSALPTESPMGVLDISR
jgi:hypothetical protein